MITSGSQRDRAAGWQVEPWSYRAETLTNPEPLFQSGCSRHLGLLRGSFGLWISRAPVHCLRSHLEEGCSVHMT